MITMPIVSSRVISPTIRGRPPGHRTIISTSSMPRMRSVSSTCGGPGGVSPVSGVRYASMLVTSVRGSIRGGVSGF